MINYTVEIYNDKDKKWDNYTKNAIFPLKTANFQGEQLLEAQLTLKRVKGKEYFLPNTLVKIGLINVTNNKYSYNDYQRVKSLSENTKIEISYDENTKKITEKHSFYVVIANDSSVEQPIGSGFYNHEIYLIEPTKILEGYIGENLSFTNPLGSNYIESWLYINF